MDQLTVRDVVESKLRYESRFTDVNPQGPEGVFSSKKVDELIGLLDQVRVRVRVTG